MNLETEKYVRKPVYVEAVKVTEDNFFAAAMWCNGDVIPEGEMTEFAKKHIRVRVHSPQSEKQKRAMVGYWILYSNRGYKVYTDRAFKASFDPEPTGEVKRAMEELKKTLEETKTSINSAINDTAKKYFRSGDQGPNTATSQYLAICDTCGNPKGTHAIGELCNANCGGTVIANPELESQGP